MIANNLQPSLMYCIYQCLPVFSAKNLSSAMPYATGLGVLTTYTMRETTSEDRENPL